MRYHSNDAYVLFGIINVCYIVFMKCGTNPVFLLNYALEIGPLFAFIFHASQNETPFFIQSIYSTTHQNKMKN